MAKDTVLRSKLSIISDQKTVQWKDKSTDKATEENGNTHHGVRCASFFPGAGKQSCRELCEHPASAVLSNLSSKLYL